MIRERAASSGPFFSLQSLVRLPTNPLCSCARTCYGGAEDRVRSIEAGFDQHLVKPVDGRELRRIIDGLAKSSTSFTL